VERANARTATPVVFIHGLWLLPSSWASWAEVFLKWVVSHPAVTCAIPATRRVEHLRENMRALSGPLPDAALRKRIAGEWRA